MSSTQFIEISDENFGRVKLVKPKTRVTPAKLILIAITAIAITAMAAYSYFEL